MITAAKPAPASAIDRFRLIAAVLIVGVHTYPFMSVSEDINFFVIHVFARIAVPFFLMVTGYFLLPRYLGKGMKLNSTNTQAGVINGGENDNPDTGPLLRFIKKAALLYAGASLLYLPISIYAGHYTEVNIAATVVRNILFDGMFYHLWYLPASILGVLLLYVLGRKFSFRLIFVFAIILYVLGLLGDSYYGITTGIPFLYAAYDAVFNVFSHTRNGLFYAPVFLAMGAFIAMAFTGPGTGTAPEDMAGRRTMTYVTAAGFVVFMSLMLLEGFVLRRYDWQRHTSMYIALVPCMFFLFMCVLGCKGKSSAFARDVSMWIFIFHPMMIIAVRGGARVVGLTGLLVENSIGHFIAVCAASVVFSVLWAKLLPLGKEAASRFFMRKDEKSLHPQQGFQRGRAWIELDMKNLRHNVDILQKQLPEDCLLMPAVKANAYGHGAVEISRELNAYGIQTFCVASVLEGVELREHGITGEILVLGYTHPQHFCLLKKHCLTQTVIDLNYAKMLDKHIKKLPVHIKVDTGMRRLGEDWENIDNIIQIFGCKNLDIKGIFTHLCTDDGSKDSDIIFAQKQIDCFDQVLLRLKQHGIMLPKAHIQSSYGVFKHPDLSFDYARVGIALYGMLSTRQDTDDYQTGLLPVLSLKARISAVKALGPGESAGYGLTFTAQQDAKIAILAIGYADGVHRGLSCGVGNVLINGQKAPIVGLICMDQTMVDITGIDDVKQGDIAVIIGKSGKEEITACEIAEQVRSIANDILSRLGQRLEITI